MLYNVSLDGEKMAVSFGEPADNDAIVREVKGTLDALEANGKLRGNVLKIDGRASVPVAFVIAHATCHLYRVVAVFDPKLDKFVVVTAHGAGYAVGDLID